MHCLEYVKAGHGSEMLAVLFKYFAEKERLRVGGLLLPQLIEFYMWLTEDVCHLLTIEQASSKPIAELVTKKLLIVTLRKKLSTLKSSLKMSEVKH